MRLLLELDPTAEYAYQNDYYNNIQGILYNSLKGTEFEDKHNDSQAHPFTFSNIFPWSETFKQGETKHLLVASHNDQIIGEIAEHLSEKQYLEAGEMRFEIKDISVVEVDVGPPGTKGIIQTPTGILTYKNFYEENTSKPFTYWKENDGLSTFQIPITKNAQWKFDKYTQRSINEETPTDLFDMYNLKKTFSIRLNVTESTPQTFILSDWKLHYTVKDQQHRRWLNTLLDVGLGWRNQLGFGFLNITTKELPHK